MKQVTLGCCGASADYDRLQTYDQKTAHTGRFCPYCGAPVDDIALAHFHGPDLDRFKDGVEYVKKQLKKAAPK